MRYTNSTSCTAAVESDSVNNVQEAVVQINYDPNQGSRAKAGVTQRKPRHPLILQINNMSRGMDIQFDIIMGL